MAAGSAQQKIEQQNKAEMRGALAESRYIQPSSAVEEYRAAVADEYGTYVAVEAIDFDGARAYNVGDPVPVTNVERYSYLDRGLVAKIGTKAAEDVPTPVVPAQG